MADTLAPLVSDKVPLNQVKYAARDYPSIFDSLLTRLKSEYGEVYNDYATTVQGIMLIELMSYASSHIQWYLDRISSDCFLTTARTPEAVSRGARQIGYKMRPAAASSVTLRLTFPNGTLGAFTMPARWKFQGPSLIFESYSALVEAAALAPGDYRDVDVRQGETFILTFTGDGTANQNYRLSSVPSGRWMADLSAEVWVDGFEWEEREFLTYVNDEQFEVDYAADPPVLRFGDGIAGKIPDSGAEIKVRFVVIDGAAGNYAKAHSITSSIDTLVVGGEVVTIEVDNALAPNGGTDPETKDHARRLAPVSFAARGAAITAPDYYALSNSFVDPLYGAVAKAFAYTPRGSYSDIVFNGLVSSVRSALDAYVLLVSSFETDIDSAATDLFQYVMNIGGLQVDLETVRSSLETYIGSAKSSCQGASASCDDVIGASNSASDISGDLITDLGNLYAYVDANVAVPATKTEILNRITDMLTMANSVQSKSLSASGDAAAASVAINGAISGFLNPSLDILTNPAPVAPDLSIPAILVDLDTQVLGIATDVIFIQGRADSIVGEATVLSASIDPVLDQMVTRIAEIFSDDCMSNLVQVPVLSVDADGNYVSPPVGLIKGLQVYLDAVKEVTQQVEVVDGAFVLVPATITIWMRVMAGYVFSEEEARVRASVIALLKGRGFNQPLYLSDLHETVQDASPGMIHADIVITGPVASLDSAGNLVPDANKVITMGSLSITNLDA